ncbi:MAG: hypothetical protein WCN95_14420 [bacterium]
MWTNDPAEMVIWMVLAFCGGVFGAAVGGLCAFVFCGLAAVISSVCMLSGAAGAAGAIDAWVTWGPFLGPQASFLGGGWAAVYAQHHAGFHNGRDICKPLAGLNRPDVLLVGGLGGLCGAFCTWLCWKLPGYSIQGMTDPLPSTNAVATGIAVAAIIGRLLFGKTGAFGKVDSNVRRWVGSEQKCWVPWQHDNLQLMLLAVTVGFFGAYLTYINVNFHLLMFGVLCVLYTFMILGQAVIAAHHFAICAFFATAVTGNVAWGLAFAVLAGYLCEMAAFLFTAYGDSHIDPPTVGITLCCIIQPFLLWTGIMPYSPLTGPTVKENLFSFKQAFMTNGNVNGLIALALVLVLAPVCLKLLRMIPSADERRAKA